MKLWAVIDLTMPDAPPIHVGRSRLYARYLALWLGSAVVIPWERATRDD